MATQWEKARDEQTLGRQGKVGIEPNGKKLISVDAIGASGM